MKAQVAIGAWAAAIYLAFTALCGQVFAEDGAQAAANAKTSTQALAGYLSDARKRGERPDYSKPPASEHLHRVFNAGALASLLPPQVGDLTWLLDWTVAASQSYKAIILFGSTNDADLHAAVAVNLLEYQDAIDSAQAFMLRLGARMMHTFPIFLRSLPPEPEAKTKIRKAGMDRTGRGVFQIALGSVATLGEATRPNNARLLASALQDTVDVWARYGQIDERKAILRMLTKARVVNKDAGIDEALNTVATAIGQVKD